MKLITEQREMALLLGILLTVLLLIVSLILLPKNAMSFLSFHPEIVTAILFAIICIRFIGREIIRRHP